MDQSVHVVERIFSILEYLSQAGAPKGPTEIAAATGIHKSTVYRLLTSLCKEGYVEHEPTGGQYKIGIKLVEIVSNHIDSLELQTEARPYLYELRTELNLVVHLGVLDNNEVIYVEKIDIIHNLRLYAQIGLRVPAYCTSLGKCMLSCLSGDDLDYLLGRKPLKRFTPKTITDYHALKDHLRKVRMQGWAIDDEEYTPGHRCIAAPIFDYRGDLIAAVSASGPTSLLTEDRLTQVVERVKTTAAEISRRLCYTST